MADTLINRSEATMNRNEIIFEVTEAPEGGYDARALGPRRLHAGRRLGRSEGNGQGRGALPLR